MGLLSKADRAMLEIYCVTYSRWRRAIDNLAKYGDMIVTKDKKIEPSPTFLKPTERRNLSEVARRVRTLSCGTGKDEGAYREVLATIEVAEVNREVAEVNRIVSVIRTYLYGSPRPATISFSDELGFPACLSVQSLGHPRSGLGSTCCQFYRR